MLSQTTVVDMFSSIRNDTQCIAIRTLNHARTHTRIYHSINTITKDRDASTDPKNNYNQNRKQKLETVYEKTTIRIITVRSPTEY